MNRHRRRDHQQRDNRLLRDPIVIENNPPAPVEVENHNDEEAVENLPPVEPVNNPPLFKICFESSENLKVNVTVARN